MTTWRWRLEDWVVFPSDATERKWLVGSNTLTDAWMSALKISRITCTPTQCRQQSTDKEGDGPSHQCIVSTSSGQWQHAAFLRQAARPQLSAIIRDLSLHWRAVKIAGCRLRGQEIAAAEETSASGRSALFADVSKRFWLLYAMTSRVETCRCSPSPSSNYLQYTSNV